MTATTPILQQIEKTVADIPGWTPIDQLLSLFTLAYSSGDIAGDILEVGSWCGRSAVVLGMAARLTGSARVHCIDLFPDKGDWYQNKDGSYSLSVTIDGKAHPAYTEQTVWAEPFKRDIAPVYERFQGTLQAFNSAVANNGLSGRVIPIKGDLQTFATVAENDFKLRMAFIDGDHSYRAVARDISQVERFLSPGGWICFDDAFSTYPGVNEAIERHVIQSKRFSQGQQLTRKLFVARHVGST